MKTFKQIASVLTSAVMLSSTVALAAAANYPTPFVKSGMADVAIVWGSNAQLTDLAAAIDITSDLAGELAAQTATTGSSTSSSSVSGGDFVLLERASDKFNLGDSADDFFSSLDDEELSTVLADGIYSNDNNDDYDFTQKIELGNALVLEHFQDSDFMDDKPSVGFNLADGDHVLNYTLDFTPDAAEGGAGFADLETTDLTLLGRSYYVVQAQNVSGSPKITLLDSANSAIVTQGQASTITVGDKTYNVEITFIDSDETILKVDGVTTNKLQEGDVFKISGDTYVALKNVLYSSKENEVSQAEISIGSGKIVLQNAVEVKINNEDVSDIAKYNDASLTAYITNSGQDVDKIVLSWDLGDDTFIAAGSDLTLPGFETIKLSMANFVTPETEMTSIGNDGDDSYKLTTNVEDGKVSLNLLYTNASSIIGIGKDTTKKLVTANSSSTSILFDTDTDDWFVASWVSGDDAESYVLKVSDISGTDAAKNTTTIESVASGSTLSKELDHGESEDFGRVRLTANRPRDDVNNVTISISAAGGSGTVSFDKIYTKEGLRIQLPVDSTSNSAATGGINFTNNAYPSSYVLQFREENEDNTIDSGGRFNATLGLNSDGDTQVSSITVTDYETEDNSDIFEGYVNSSIATKTMLKTGSDQDTLDIEYHGEESYAEVYVSETGTVIDAGESTTTSGTVKKLGAIAFKDSESSSYAGKNLIVVGGSCVNTVAASLLGSSSPLCGADFTTKTTVGAGSFLIETFSQASGKVATLVAGYNAGDTTAAAKYLITQPVDTTAGKKEVKTVASVSSLI